MSGERLAMPVTRRNISRTKLTSKKRQTVAQREIAEQHITKLERSLPSKSGVVFAKARKKALDAGFSVLQSEQGVIYKFFPDRSRRKVKEIEKPTQFKRGLKLQLW